MSEEPIYNPDSYQGIRRGGMADMEFRGKYWFPISIKVPVSIRASCYVDLGFSSPHNTLECINVIYVSLRMIF